MASFAAQDSSSEHTDDDEQQDEDGSQEETRRMLMDAQATSTYFRGFTEHMPVLVESLSISPFDAGETILQEGEEGTWLGVLLKGELDVVVNGNLVHRVRPGEIVGEMIVWFGGVRQATLKAATSGVIATLLMGELQALSCRHPAVATQFMRVMGTQSLNSYLAFKAGSKMKGIAAKMSAPVLVLEQATADEAAPHWEAFFAPLREHSPISVAAAACFAASATVHKFEKVTS